MNLQILCFHMHFEVNLPLGLFEKVSIPFVYVYMVKEKSKFHFLGIYSIYVHRRRSPDFTFFGD